jgi:glutathione peroxidase
MRKYVLSFLAMLGLTVHAQQSIHEFSFKTIDGTEKSFSEYKGRKILIVNVASECGYTPQYAALQELHEMRWDKLAIVAFPANNFGGQEPGDNKDIASFCAKNFGVTFQMAAKVSVKGRDIDPLFEWLNDQENPDFTGDIKWNFEKYLLDENGILIHRYRSAVEPDDEALLGAIG